MYKYTKDDVLAKAACAKEALDSLNVNLGRVAFVTKFLAAADGGKTTVGGAGISAKR